MNFTFREYGSFILCSLAIIFIAGCTGSEKYYSQAALSRQEAFNRWKNRKALEQQNQTRITGQLSLQDCIKLALTNNKMLQFVLQEKEFARGQELSSYSAILPEVSLSGEYKRLDEVASFDIPSGGTISLGDIDNYSASLRVTQPLFSGGAIPAAINAGRLSVLLADQMVRAALQDVIYLSVRSYYDVLLNQYLYQISADAVRSAQAHLDDVKQKRSGGVASDFDVLRAEVELSNFNADLIQNKNTINIAKTQLLKTMGISQDSSFTLSDVLIYVPMKIEMAEAVEVAYSNRPDLFGQEFNTKLQRELLTTARSKYWPTISGFYDNVWAKPDPHSSTEIKWGHSWYAGVMAAMPIFDGLSREGEIIQQKARLRQSQIDLIDAEETALFELTKALLSIENTEEFVQSQQLNLSRAAEGSRLAEVGYREGINTQVEVIDAESALTKAKSLYYEAIYSHMVAKLDLQKAMGVLSPQLQDDIATKGEEK
ncbi:MAG: TolC family protein [Sedimentisphaerales bacterium]|nr:TolC family protein [Sedimentisphaerales bacterium]